MAGENLRQMPWEGGMLVLLITLAGCAHSRPCSGVCQPCDSAIQCAAPDLFPVPTQPVFASHSEPETAESAQAERQGGAPASSDQAAPLGKELPPPPEIIPSPPPAGSDDAGAVPSGSKSARKKAAAPSGNTRGPSWVFHAPVPESVLRQMQPTVELKTDPDAKAAAPQSRR